MITAFCMLAEPEILMYPYVESIRSVSSFADKVIVRYASADKSEKNYRHFEKASYEKLKNLSEELKADGKELEIVMDSTWTIQKLQNYEELRSKLQIELEKADEWFLKFDADNVFRSEHAEEIRSLFCDQFEKIIFRRVNVTNKKCVGINMSSEDIYAINLKELRRKKIEYSIGGKEEWCRAVVHGEHRLKIVEEIEKLPVNYDATFFTKDRVVNFWRLTEQAYSFSHSRVDRFINMTDEEVLESYVKYRKGKIGNRINEDFQHPNDIRARIECIPENLWGYNNFGNKIGCL